LCIIQSQPCFNHWARSRCPLTSFSTSLLSGTPLSPAHYRYTKGSSPKGRNVFLKNMEPFMTWLDEAEDESEEE
jgi:hypothetical protein